VTAALLSSPSFALFCCSATKQALQRSIAFFAMLRCNAAPQEQTLLVELRYKAAPQTNKQNKRKKKK